MELTELDDEGAQATTGSSMVAARKIEDAVVHSIMSCGDNVDLRQKLFSMIILTGGCARIRGMSEVRPQVILWMQRYKFFSFDSNTRPSIT